MKRRLSRAKTKIKLAGIPFAVPADHLLPERLTSVLQDFSQRLYQQAQSQASASGAPGGAAGGSAPSDDEVADAEIVDEPGEQSA